MSQIKTLWLLLAMALIIALPWVAAHWVVDHADDMDLSIQVSGEIIDPIIDFNALAWQDAEGGHAKTDAHWWLIAKSEVDRAAWLQSMRYALGSDANRIRLALLCADGDCLTHSQGESLDALYLSTNLTQFAALNQAQAYLVDPEARVVMVFPSIESSKAIVKDIKHLLKASHIG